MQRVLVTGVSGVGKSAVITELTKRGFRAVDLDSPYWSEWVDSPDGGPSPARPGQDWLWREDRVEALLDTEDADVLFVSGCAPNQRRFLGRFDHVVLLSTPVEVMIDRLTTRTGNAYGKGAGELERSVGFKDTVEPLLRSAADHEIDTRVPLDQVVTTLLALARR